MDLGNFANSRVTTFLADGGPLLTPLRLARARRDVIEPILVETNKVMRTSRDLSEIRYAQGVDAAFREFLRLIGDATQP